MRCTPDGRNLPISFISARPGGGGRFKLQPERDSDYIRTKFYLDTSASRSAIVGRKLPGLLSSSNPAIFLSEGDPSAEAAQGYTIRDVVTGKALVPVVVASPDHNPTPIASHWNVTGSKNQQTLRENWNRNLATFKLMSLRLILSCGSGGVNDLQEVDIGFRGPGE
jgi:hypothetical protein